MEYSAAPQPANRDPCLSADCPTVAASRHCSLHEYGIDPESREGPRILTAAELAIQRAPIAELITNSAAWPE